MMQKLVSRNAIYHAVPKFINCQFFSYEFLRMQPIINLIYVLLIKYNIILY